MSSVYPILGLRCKVPGQPVFLVFFFVVVLFFFQSHPSFFFFLYQTLYIIALCTLLIFHIHAILFGFLQKIKNNNYYTTINCSCIIIKINYYNYYLKLTKSAKNKHYVMNARAH